MRFFPELLTPSQSALLEAHYELLLKWNKTLNLTRIEDRDEALERHYGESLFLAQKLPEGVLRIADIGSGAGFPGFPVAVYRPDCQVTLIESHQRKAVFLKEAARNLPNVRVLAQRAEDVKETFDIAISRAVSYADLAKPLRHFAPVAYLLTGALTGAEEPPTAGMTIGTMSISTTMSIRTTIPLPTGKQRFLRIVSRETP